MRLDPKMKPLHGTPAASYNQCSQEEKMKGMGDVAKKATFSVSGNIINMWLLAFVVLKLCNVINWSWWWVLSPAWIPVAAGLVIMLLGAILTAFTFKR